MSGEAEETDEFAVLKSPIRRHILLSLYYKGETTASELKSLTNVSYGTLYYHLEVMKLFIELAGRGRFRLNDNGRKLVRRLIDEQAAVKEPRAAEWWEVLTLGYLISLDSKRLSGIAVIGGISLAFTIYLSFSINVYPVVLHLRSGQPSLFSWSISLLMLLGYLSLVYYVLRRDGGSPGLLLMSASMSYLPLMAYLSSLFILNNLLRIEVNIHMAQAGFMIAHIWQLIILASILTHSTGTGYSKTLPAMLLYSYISLIVYLTI